MNDPVSVIGIGMTPMSHRDLTPVELTTRAAREALADAGLSASEVGLVLAATRSVARSTIRRASAVRRGSSQSDSTGSAS